MNKARLIGLAGSAATAAKNSDGNIADKLRGYLRMFRDIFLRRYKPKKRNLILGTLVLIYVISPLDLMPGILLDDIAILMIAFNYFGKELNRYYKWENETKYQTVKTEGRIINE